MSGTPLLGHTPEQRAYRYLVMCMNVMIASRNFNLKSSRNDWAIVQEIAVANDIIATLRRAEHIFLSTPQMREDLQLELDMET